MIMCNVCVMVIILNININVCNEIINSNSININMYYY